MRSRFISPPPPSLGLTFAQAEDGEPGRSDIGGSWGAIHAFTAAGLIAALLWLAILAVLF